MYDRLRRLIIVLRSDDNLDFEALVLLRVVPEHIFVPSNRAVRLRGWLFPSVFFLYVPYTL